MSLQMIKCKFQSCLYTHTNVPIPTNQSLAFKVHSVQTVQILSRLPGMRHFYASEHPGGWDAEVEVSHELGGGGPVHAGKLPSGQLVRVQGDRPGLDVHHVARLLRLQQLDHLNQHHSLRVKLKSYTTIVVYNLDILTSIWHRIFSYIFLNHLTNITIFFIFFGIFFFHKQMRCNIALYFWPIDA